MKELPLSVLSRGCGHLVPLEEGGHDGRLEVCFEPEDYFSWRARPLLLRLSRSGRLMGGGVEDPTPPKTYSTRKGHLILYSEDLVSSSSQSAANRKGQGSKQEAEPPLHTLRDLTGAILAYKRKQPREGHATGEGHPLLSRLTPPSHAHLSSAQRHPRDRLSQLTDSFDEVPSSGRFPPTPTPAALAQVPYHPRFLCSPRPSHAPSEPLPPITEGLLSQRGDGRAYLQKDIGGTSALGDFECPLTSTDGGGTHSGQYKANIPSAPMILCCSPEPGPQQEVERVRSEETHEPAHLHGSGCVENASGHGKCSLKRASVDSTWRSSRLSHINFYGGHLAGSHRVNTGQYARMGLRGRRKEDVMSDPSFSILRLPPLPRGPVVSTGSDGHGPQGHGGSSMTLPPIPEGAPLTHTHTPATPARRPDTPAPDLTHTQPRPKMADSRDTAALRESERQAPRRILLLIPRATKEEEAERSGGVIHGVHTEDEVTERGDRENREKERRMETDTREMDRGNGKEEGEKEQGMDKEMREKRRKMEADDNVGESGESGEARHQRAQPQLGQRAFTLVGLNHQHLLLLETQRGAALSPSLGTLPPLTGRRGPGKQSSMAAYRLNPPEPPEPGQSQPGIVRGSIPVELRDWQKGGGWGTLIMGPDGDIIRLSLWDPTGQQQLSLDDVTEEHAVRILVSEGEEAGQSWTLLLKPEATVPGEDCLGKADATSDNSEAYHSSMRRVTRVGVCVNEIKSEGRCGSATDNGAPVEGQVLLLTQSQTSSQPQTPERRGAASGDQPVITAHSTPLLTGEEAEKKPGARGRIAQHTGSDRRREMDRAGGEDTLPDADGDSASPSVLRDDSSPSGHPTIPPVEAPSDPSIPQCLSGVDLEAMETHTKTAGATPSVRDVERERRGGGGEKGGRRDRKRGEEEQSGGQERQKASQRQQREEKGRHGEGGLPEEEEEEKEENEEVGERRRPSEKEKGAPTASSVRKRERKTEGENKKVMKEGAGTSKAPRAGGRRGGRAGVKGQDVFVVGKPRKKQEQKTGVEKSERKNPEEDEPLVEQKEEEEEQQAPGDDKIGHFGDTVERPISAEWDTASSSRSQHSDDSSAPVSRGQSSRQPSLPGEALPSSPPPMSLHQLTSRSASTATDSYVMKPSQSEDSVHVNNSRTAEEVARQRERQAAARAEKAERRRQEVERKRREREEEKRRLLEREETEERMRQELEEEQRRRAEEASLKRQQEEEERERREAEELERGRREEAERERERRRQEEKRRQMERMQRLRQEEEKRRAEEQERLRVEEEQRRAEERRRVQEMEESERRDYLQRLQEEEEERSRVEQERRRRQEEALLWAKEQARVQAQLQARQRALLEQRLSFQRGLQQEAGGLGQSQDISRPWVFSYFTLLQLLGLSDPASSPEGPDSPQLTPT